MSSDSVSGRELQLLENNLQHVLMQKQSLEIELNESSNALKELDKSTDEVYKVVGNIMLRSNKSELKKELEEKKRVIEMHLNAIEKQESLIEMKAAEIRRKPSSSHNEKK